MVDILEDVVRDDTPSAADQSAAVALGARPPAQSMSGPTEPAVLQRLTALQSSVDALSRVRG